MAEYLQAGAPVSLVQGLLGHAGLATTGVYLHVTDQMAKQITPRTQTALEGMFGGRTQQVGYDLDRAGEDPYIDQVLE